MVQVNNTKIRLEKQSHQYECKTDKILTKDATNMGDYKEKIIIETIMKTVNRKHRDMNAQRVDETKLLYIFGVLEIQS